MTQRRKVSSGSAYESAVGYSRAVRTGPHIVVAGTTAEGDSIAAQTRESLPRIEIALQKGGASLSDVVRTRIYVTDISMREVVGAVHTDVFREIRPSATLAEVSARISTLLHVEIELDTY